jgi:ferric-dicitrate binding protein FerR (iron transport regulator)
LKPNEQASISNTKGISLTEGIGTENVNSWAKGEFFYLNEPLATIAKDLERRFNVTISIQNEKLANEIFTYHADENTTIEQILRHLKETKELTYLRKKDHIEIVKLKK